MIRIGALHDFDDIHFTPLPPSHKHSPVLNDLDETYAWESFVPFVPNS